MEIRVDLSGPECILLALMGLVVPLDWLMAAFLAAAVHECAHLLAVLALGGRIESLHIGMGGAVMEAQPLEQWKQLVCILAGPLGSLLLLLFCSRVPKLAICGLIQGTFNLMPLYPLDGGRLMRCAVRMFFSEGTADKICRAVKYAALLCVFIAGIWGTAVLKLGLLPLVTALWFLSGIMDGKISCKDGLFGVQ